MKKSLLLLLSCFVVWQAGAQTFWTENWNGTTCASGCTTYTGTNGSWTATATGTNGAAANVWYFSYAEQGERRDTCGSASGTHASAHVGNVSSSPTAYLICPSGDCGAINDDYSGAPSDRTNIRLESPTINCTGKSTITLSFNYIEQGDSVHDFATVWYYNGTSWSQIAKPIQTNNVSCSGQGYWTNYTIALPASADNNANVKIGFNWYNDTLGTAVLAYPNGWPSFAVDSISLSIPPLGINQLGNNSIVNIFPNPNHGVFTIELSSEKLKVNGIAEIYNMLGQQVYTSSFGGGVQRTEEELDLSSQPSGIYLYRVISGDGKQIANGKFIINK